MQWPYKTTVRFESVEGIESRLDYWVSATDSEEAERTLKERLINNEVFGYRSAGDEKRSRVDQSPTQLRHATRLAERRGAVSVDRLGLMHAVAPASQNTHQSRSASARGRAKAG